MCIPSLFSHITIYHVPRVLLQSDFFALELVSGHLYLHLGLGSEPLKFRASRHSNQLANGEWHKVISIETTIEKNRDN